MRRHLTDVIAAIVVAVLIATATARAEELTAEKVIQGIRDSEAKIKNFAILGSSKTDPRTRGMNHVDVIQPLFFAGYFEASGRFRFENHFEADTPKIHAVAQMKWPDYKSQFQSNILSLTARRICS
jgi:hypothetical protein